VPSQIAEIDDADIPAVVALWGRCNLTRPWNDPVEDIRIARASGHGAILVARDGDTVVGAAMTGHDGHRGAIYYLAVEPGARRAGLGRALVAACEAWCRARGVPKVNLLVRKENPGVLAFYEALGYRDTDAVCLYHNLDPDKGAREVAMKAAWAQRLARAE
jgi:ribosomal protein S18 acetylase RimI-like enzyme